MARDAGEQQAMTSERLAEIRVKAYDAYDWDDWKARAMLGDLLTEHDRMAAEVERLRAREAALVEVVRMVADGVVMDVINSQAGSDGPVVADALVLPFGAIQHKEQARALLASADSEGSGGDGA